MIIRTIRDIFTGDVDSIYIDEPTAYERAKEFLQIVMPRYVSRLQLYEGKEPLFHRYRLDEEISSIHQRKVPLRQGGSIVIDQTEALVAIDVNSGNFRADDSAEETAYQMNIAAAKEIARQLRLARPGRRDRQRLHRHAQGAASPRRRAGAARRGAARPRPHEDSAHQPLRPDRNDAAADSPQPEAERLQGLPLLHGHRRGEDGREHGDRGDAAADPGGQRAGREPHFGVTVHDEVATYLNNKKRREIAQLEDEGKMAVQVVRPRECFARAPGDRMPRCARARSEVRDVGK